MVLSKITKKKEISQQDQKMLRLFKIAQEIVLKEDEQLFKELAKH